MNYARRPPSAPPTCAEKKKIIIKNIRRAAQVVLPYVAEENHDEDPEVQVKPDSESAAARTAKDAIFSSRKEVRALRICLRSLPAPGR